MTGYKLFEQDKNGKLFPLFIGKKNNIPVGKWQNGENIPTKGFSHRPGWHVGDIPDAPWLKGYDGSEKGIYKSRFRKGKRVWCLVEYNSNHDYTDEVEKLPGKCMLGQLPNDGFYRFREIGRRAWFISSHLKVIRVMDEQERQRILESLCYDEAGEYRRYKHAMEKRLNTINSN